MTMTNAERQARYRSKGYKAREIVVDVCREFDVVYAALQRAIENMIDCGSEEEDVAAVLELTEEQVREIRGVSNEECAP
jgi:hypothetical protein